MALGEIEGGVAERPRYRAFRRYEVGRARRIQDVLVGRVATLLIVAVEQAFRRKSPHHELELPDQIVGVLHAAVRAAGAEWRNEMRGIAAEQHAAVAKALHPPALERVDARPLEFEPRVGAEHGAQARQNPLGPFLLLRICLRTELEIDTPDVVGLAVQQHGLAGMKRRIEPEPALGGKSRRHPDVRDQESIVKYVSLRLEPEQ